MFVAIACSPYVIVEHKEFEFGSSDCKQPIFNILYWKVVLVSVMALNLLV